jgi:hypothetical protein
MKRLIISLFGFTLLAFGSALQAQTSASFRVLLGVTDTSTRRWDGTISATQAGSLTLDGWRFEGVDNINGNLFHMATHPARLFNNPTGGDFVANGLIINADAVTDSSEFIFTSAQGDFRFRASEVPYGSGVYKLGGRVHVDRLPAATRLSDSPDEEDYPSMASAGNGDVWLAYVQFHHNPDHLKLRVGPRDDPKKYAQYRQPTGGDQIWVRRYSRGTWGQPIPVTKPGADLYRTAVAVDGRGRAWVFWSENSNGNFDIFARAVDGSAPGDQVQISKEAGSDIDPVATTDASGQVWVAWQGWRNGHATILAAHQSGNGFSLPEKIPSSNKNEWNPAIAADKTGGVAIAWDSYRSGNYDVYVRTWVSNSWRTEFPVAASSRYEAFPSIAYDPGGRLWIAYEEGSRGWGKDFGAYSTTGVALYQGRAIKMRGLERDGSLVVLDASLDSKLVGAPSVHVNRTHSQSDSQPLDPDPEAVRRRLPDAAFPPPQPVAKNSLPRLTIDGSGRMWLAFRTAHPIFWSPLGTVWSENLVSFDGKVWTSPIFLNHSDNLLDNRPALISTTNGKLLIVNSSDGRRNFQVAQSQTNLLGLDPNSPADPYNNDLWSHAIDLGPGNQTIPVVAAGRDAMPEAHTTDRVDAAATQTIRDYRGGPDGNLRIARGEFHRHSEISMDGGNDGTLLDQWRYVLDASDMDWVGCCDHDNGGGREYSWWITQKITDVFHTPGKFIPMFSYERSVVYPEGHRNVIFAQRGIRPLPRLPVSKENDSIRAPDTQMLYGYLREFNGISASHTSATAMGTDWRDNDPGREPVVEIYQGDRQNYEMPEAPRSNSEKDSIGGWRPKGFVSVALDKGYRLGFEASSDHISTHMSYCNLFVKDLTRESVLEAFQKRHVYAATENILADVQSGSHLMGDEFSTIDLPSLKVRLKGTSKFAKVVIVRDGKYVYSTSPNSESVEFSWRDNQPNKGKATYYYVRGEQDNGEIVWTSPLWITYDGKLMSTSSR